jgi:hypothetical protein
MTDRKLMQQALHTLEGWANHGEWVWPESALEQAKRNTIESITALRERLAQPNEFQPDWDAMAVMVAEQQRMAKRIEELEAQPEQKPVAWVYPEGLEAFKSGKPWTAYGGSGDGSHSDGVQRIPLYLNDAVAPRAEPRLGGSGAGFESLPASPQWQGLTDEDVDEVERWIEFKEDGSGRIPNQKLVRYIERKLKEKNS